MRLSASFGRTRRQVTEVPPAHGLFPLLRGGFVARPASGPLVILPLGLALLQRVRGLWRQAFPQALEMAAPDGATALWRMPSQPGGPPQAHLPAAWRAWLPEQVVSYRDLPRRLWGTTPQAWWALALGYPSPAWAALEAFWRALGLAAEAWEGAEGVRVWAVPHPEGPAEALACSCGYRALQPWAQRQVPLAGKAPPEPLRPVATPGANTIAALTAFLGVSPVQTAKALLLTDASTGDLVFVVVRGDTEVSLPKVQAALDCGPLRPATEEEIRAVGAEPGYASPIGLRGVRVVVDRHIPTSPNLVAGANRPGTHYQGVNYGRDFTAEKVADLVAAHPGDPCPVCGAPLTAQRVIPLAQAGPAAPEPAWTCPGPQGQALPVLWAPFRLDLEGLFTALGATFGHPQGLNWPEALAPFAVHLVALRGGEEAAERLYSALQQAGVGVLYDDRRESPGVKFTDADLIGLPWRVTVSKRSLAQGGAEVRRRASGAEQILPLEAVPAALQAAAQEEVR